MYLSQPHLNMCPQTSCIVKHSVLLHHGCLAGSETACRCLCGQSQKVQIAVCARQVLTTELALVVSARLQQQQALSSCNAHLTTCLRRNVTSRLIWLGRSGHQVRHPAGICLNAWLLPWALKQASETLHAILKSLAAFSWTG